MYDKKTYEPRIYVACLAAYNNDKLHGEWIDADQDPEDIQVQINEMLRRSPEPDAEEYAIHDYEEFGGFSVDEHESIEDVSEMARMTAEHGEAIGLYYDYLGCDLNDLETEFENSYEGYSDNELKYAEELFDDIYEVPDNIANYIDYEAFARDLFMSDCVALDANDGGIHVFRIC